MIAGISGKVVDIRAPYLTIDVRDVWYLVAVPHSENFVLGDAVSLYTYLAVRENALDLYGFQNRDDLIMFEELIKIPKIGPKTALQILSQADIAIIKKAVGTNDPAYLSKMSGVGKKSAEKIVAGLKDTLPDEFFSEDDRVGAGLDADVIDALIALGYAQRDVALAVQKIPLDVVGTNARVTFALRIIGN